MFPSPPLLSHRSPSPFLFLRNWKGSDGSDGGEGYIEARFTVGLPARGRSIEGRWAATILTRTVPALALDSLRWGRLDALAAAAHVRSVDDQEALRGLLRGANLVAFVIDGAILPRRYVACACVLCVYPVH